MAIKLPNEVPMSIEIQKDFLKARIVGEFVCFAYKMLDRYVSRNVRRLEKS